MPKVPVGKCLVFIEAVGALQVFDLLPDLLVHPLVVLHILPFSASLQRSCATSSAPAASVRLPEPLPQRSGAVPPTRPGPKALRSHPRGTRSTFYARSCKRTSENAPSTHSGQYLRQRYHPSSNTSARLVKK